MGVYTSLKDAQLHILGIRGDFKRFTTRKKAEAYVALQVTLGQTPLNLLPRCGSVHGRLRLAGIGVYPVESVPCWRLRPS